MWLITTFSESNIRMYEFQNKNEAENVMKRITIPKVLTFIDSSPHLY
jgi:hypothetical protein